MSRMPLFGLESYTTISRPSFYLQSDLSEVVSEGLSIENRIEDISEALVQVGHLSEATRVMAVALNSGERVSPYALENFVILRDNVYKNLGRDVERYPSYLTIAEEGVSYRSALRLSLEEEKEVKKGIWQRIKEFFSKLWENLTNFFKKLFGLKTETEKTFKESVKLLNEYDSAINSWDQSKLNEEYNKLLKSNIFSVGFYSGEYDKAKLLFKLPDVMGDNVKFTSEVKWEVKDLTKIDFKNKPTSENEKLCYVNVELDENAKKETNDANKANREDIRAFLKFMRTQIGNTLDNLFLNVNKKTSDEASAAVKEAIKKADELSLDPIQENDKTDAKGEEMVKYDSLSGESYSISKENDGASDPESYKREIVDKVKIAISNSKISMKLAKDFLVVLKKAHLLTREDYETRVNGFKAIQESIN